MTYLNSMAVDQIRAPEHLLSFSWFELEKDQALRVFSDLDKMVGKLSGKLNAGRVHNARVALRRWYSVWDILTVDGWASVGETGVDFDRSIGRKLRRLNKDLGQLRDLDVSLSLARDLHINKFVVRHLCKQRKSLKKKVEKKFAKLDLNRLITKLRKFLAAKSAELRQSAQLGMIYGDIIQNADQTENGSEEARAPRAKLKNRAKNNSKNKYGDILGHGHISVVTAESSSNPLSAPGLSAYFHMDLFLLQSEHQCRMLCEHSRSDEQLHELRLSIKRWRYLLSEFFGLTNLQLVRAQQILGRIRDLNRLKAEIAYLKRPLAKTVNRGKLRSEDLQADTDVIEKSLEEQFVLLDPLLIALPYGLRPYLLSL